MSSEHKSKSTYKNEQQQQPTGDMEIIVKYRQSVYNLTEFLKKHPGGVNTIKGLNDTDMTARFMKAPPHSDAAMYLMNEYKIKSTLREKSSKENNNQRSKENGAQFVKEELEQEDKSNNQTDKTMEHLVDWSKPMLAQIPKITNNYDEWVHMPVDRPLRLFGPSYLEMCTKTPWWVIPIFWIPIILKCVMDELLSSWQSANMQRLTLLTLYFAVGILFWTLLEYSLHRWVFHMKTEGQKSPIICTFHFLIHGLHHKVPFDPLRLVFPPVPGVILAGIIYFPLSFVVPWPRILLGGALFGYLCYDLIHYYLHYGNPDEGHLYHMKRYHYQHHFAHQDIGYGISSPLWDLIFNTRIHLRKLRHQLRWQ